MSEETIPDIVAEMRSRGSEISGLLLPDDGGPTRAMTPKLADRIEAAAKRERALLDANIARVRKLEDMMGGAADALLGAAIKQKATGNAAALRAVVERCRDYLSDLLTLISTEDETRLLKECDAALSAPARNCDRFKTEEEAYAAFMSRFKHFNGERHYQYCAWLFAPAEKGGGAE